MTKQLPKTHFARNISNLLVLDLESNIQIKLVDDEGEPLSEIKYQIQLTNNTTIDGTLDKDGYALVDGEYLDGAKVTFPELDESTWMSEEAHQEMNNEEQQG